MFTERSLNASNRFCESVSFKTCRFLHGLCLAIFLLWRGATCQAQSAAFTYQGELITDGAPASGSYDLAFTAYNASTGGQIVGTTRTNLSVAVSKGLFTTSLDFGTGLFANGSVWLEISVSPASSNSFSTLAPRQPVTPAPFAIYAYSAGTNFTQTNASPGMLTLNSNGAVISPAGFFAANANSIASAVAGNFITNNASGVTLSGSFNGNSNFPGATVTNAGSFTMFSSTINPTNIFAGVGALTATQGTQTFYGTDNPFANFEPGWNFVIGVDQYTVVNVVNPNQVTVFETVTRNYTNATTWTVYPNGLTMNDINQNHFGWIGNDASIGIVGGGNSARYFAVDGDHAIAWTMASQPDGYYLDFGGEGCCTGGAFKISDQAGYDSIAIKPSGLASFRFGLTNEHGTLELQGPVNADGPMIVGSLNVTTALSTAVPIIISNAPAGPSAGTLGANKSAAFWVSNGVVYVRTSVDGTNAVDTQIAPAPSRNSGL